MRSLPQLLAFTLAWLWAVTCWAGEAIPAARVDYTRDIKPILAARCYACHGPLKQEHDLRLDTAAAIRQGGEAGPAVEAHDSGNSLLVSAVTGADGWRMPPEGEPLSAEQIARLKRWIDAGAQGPADERPASDPKTHWAFQRPVRPALPDVAGVSWVRGPIDAFLAAEHQRQNLSPRPEADRGVLLRRVYLDLVGIPPTADELASFLADDAPDAYERVVDRLLASPQYGERWARHWMDVWRYSDWYGWAAEVRHSQPHIWRWRDWIVESLNADKGYDRMIVEMLSGDELAPQDPATLRATGYLVRNWYRFNRDTWLEDTVEHTGKAFLALTFNCARCHDHKFDPIAQQDYYRLRAFFEPHQIRTDFAGELDRTKAGLARVYDGDGQAPTYLYVRGDQRDPDKSKSCAPGLPALFCSQPLAIEPVALPAETWYPGLNPDLQAARRKQLAAEVAKTQGALAAARQELNKAHLSLAGSQAFAAAVTRLVMQLRKSAKEDIDAAVKQRAEAIALAGAPEKKKLEDKSALAAKSASAAAAALLELEAKIVAQRAKFASPADPAQEALAIAANLAEKRAAVEARERDLMLAEQAARAAAENAAANGQAKQAAGKGKKGKNPDEKLAKAHAALEEAQRALAEIGPNFTPLDAVYPSQSTGRRSALARWITDRQNPLTARVAVNHLWRRHFGRALVRSIFDFGTSGQTPTHPALLDWLAVELMDHQWSMKHLHRLMVTSAAYRFDSSCDGPSDPNLRIDPDNRFVWRANVRRADAEVIRDSILALSGDLDAALGGAELDQTTADRSNRRSIYYRQAEEKRVTFLELFDQPGGGESYERVESIVPQQALALLNSQFAIEHARTLADRLWQRSGQGLAGSAGNDSRFIELAFRHILTRPASTSELQACQSFLQNQARQLSDRGKLTALGSNERNAADKLDPAVRARGDLIHVLFNHNDFVAIR